MKTNFCFLLLLALAGCKGEDSEMSQLRFKNDLNLPIEVTLFPKPEFYSSASGQFLPSTIANGFSLTRFNINSGYEDAIYMGDKLSISPDSLMRTVFDSVTVTFGTVKLKFTPLKAEGYSVNIFQPNTNWTYEEETSHTGTQWKSFKVISWNNYFAFKDELLAP